MTSSFIIHYGDCMKKLKYFIPSFLLMIIIFGFSNQTGSESSGLSTQIVLWIQNHLHITISEFLIRKVAHMSEYAILSLTFIYGFYKSEFPTNKIYLFSFICSFLYACTDEFHQLFIGGRAGSPIDVMIDTTGAFLMILFIFILKKNVFQ